VDRHTQSLYTVYLPLGQLVTAVLVSRSSCKMVEMFFVTERSSPMDLALAVTDSPARRAECRTLELFLIGMFTTEC
jgi:hypothetical protein